MIYWKDFLITSEVGPVLVIDDEVSSYQTTQNFRKRGSRSPNIMEDVMGALIQETGQGQQPARMVGNKTSSDFIAQVGMEADGAPKNSSIANEGGWG